MINETAEMLQKGFNVQSLDGLESCDIVCAVSGRKIDQGYPIKKVISKDTSEKADILRFDSKYISESVGTVFKASGTYRGNMLVIGNEAYRPLISELSARKTRRTTWSNLFKYMFESEKIVAIITDESKRRLWHKAKVSTVGHKMEVFLNGKPAKGLPSENRILQIDYQKFLDCFYLVEEVYTVGFSKYSIITGLINQQNYKLINKIGMSDSKEYELQLKYYRNTDELLLSTFIAQKK